MDPGLVAAVMALARVCDDGRYEGCAILSALPEAPVVQMRHGGHWWSLARWPGHCRSRTRSASDPRRSDVLWV